MTKKPKTQEPRSWVVTIFASAVSLVALFGAIVNFRLEFIAIIISLLFAALAIFAAAVAIKGKHGSLSEILSAMLDMR